MVHLINNILGVTASRAIVTTSLGGGGAVGGIHDFRGSGKVFLNNINIILDYRILSN